MKFKDVKTLESILLEYGMKPGASTPTSQQQTGAGAKANKVNSPSTTQQAKKPDAGSPTLGQKAPEEKPEMPEPKQKNARDIEKGAVVVGQDDKNKTVVSPVGDGDIPDAMVVQDEDGEYEIIDQNKNVDAYDPEDAEQMQNMPSGPGIISKTKGNFAKGQGIANKMANLVASVDPDLAEGKIAKKVHRKALNKLKPKVKQEKRKVKQLARLSLKEAHEELFEINFNRKEIINSSLDAQIRCGWEAETVWENIEGESDDVDNLSLSEIDDQYGGVDWDSIAENFTDWIYEYKVDEYMDGAIDEYVTQREDDEDYINEFIENEGIEQADWDDYREDVLRREFGDERFEEEGAEELSDIYGYEEENWAREYVDEFRGQDFRDYLEELAKEDDDVRQAAYEEASESYDYDDWINDQYYSMSSFCDDYGIDYSVGSNLGEVADIVSNWMENNSAFTDTSVDYGDYGNTDGSTTNYAVESDSSIDGYGTGAEIISPVFSTPRRMLTEMKKFFTMLEDKGALTNNSTGLHVTMSYNPQEGEIVNHDPGSSIVKANRVKMAVLLGDQYLLNEFMRKANTYTKSQYKELQKAIGQLKQKTGSEGIKIAEKFLEQHISDDKFRAIHFKGQTDSKTNTKLIEFRIAGGEDYERDFDKVFKATVRYATTMIAGHTNQYEGDYVKALSRLLNKASEVAAGDESEVEDLKGRYEDIASDPVLDSTKAIISSNKYLDFTKQMLRAMEQLKLAKTYLDPEADLKWKKQWMKYVNNTDASLDDFDSSLKRDLDSIKGEKIKEEEKSENDRSIKAYFKPDMQKPSSRASQEKLQGLKDLSEALGMLAVDVAQGVARQQPNAKSIGALRTFLKKYEISYKDLDENLKISIDDIAFGDNVKGSGAGKLTPQVRMEIIRKGIEKLLSKDIISRPDYISAPQVESLVKGIWNVMNSKQFNPTVLKELTTLGINLRIGKDSNIDKTEVIEDTKRLFKDASGKRQFNDFYNGLTTSTYNSGTYFVQPGMVFDKESFNNMVSFVKQFDSYNEPVNRNHNPNIYGDDSYEDVSLSNYTMLLRRRFLFLENQFETDKSKAIKSLKLMVPMFEKFFNTNKIGLDRDGRDAYDKPDWEEIIGIERDEVQDLPNMSDKEKEDLYDLLGERDGAPYLGIEPYKYERIQGTLDDIIKNTTDERTINNMQDFITDSIRESLGAYYRNKERYPGYFKFPEVKTIIAQRFKGLSEFMRGLDKIFVQNGFDSQDNSIKRKQQLSKDRENFEKKIRSKSYATINIPAHSITFMKKNYYDELDLQRTATSDVKIADPGETMLKDMIDGAENVNKGSRPGIFFVVPAAHWGPLNDAVGGSEIIAIYQKVGNMSQNWRIKNYGKLFEKFASVYGIDYKTLDNKDKYVQIDGTDRTKLSKMFRIEFTGKLDGRAGMGDVEELIPSEELKNPFSGEPLNSTSGITWTLRDDNDQKAYAAYDFKKYHGAEAGKIKQMVDDLMNKDDSVSFYSAIQKVMEQTPKGVRAIENKKIIKAAGVEHMEREASNTIQGAANWPNLADFFKIERGVDNQGPNILEKVSRTFDGDHNWRPEPDPTVCCVERWVASVKTAVEYIKTNYTVSGGNYFRQNADGSLGDDVGELYGDGGRAMPDGARSRMDRAEVTRGRDPSDDITTQDYDAVRDEYQRFDWLMQNGIQNYMLQPDVNRLVGFLKNPDNEENFKQTVLQVLIRDNQEGKEPNDFQGALARGRQELQGGANESVFAKFDALPLQEQLAILSESKVLERPLSKDEKKDKEKYVKGMKKSKKDFEKRYGKDAEAVMYATATNMAKEDLDESVPTIKTTKILNDLLADHFPVGDLKKQMLAFQAIPIPAMLDAFRDLRGEAGDEACARGIVRHFINALPKEQQDKIDLNEWSKSKVRSLIESKGIMGRVLGDTFLKGDDRLEFQSVNLYPTDEMEFDSPEQRDDFVQQLEQELNSQIDWTNVPNKGSLAFGVAVLTDPALDDKITYWGRYFKQKTADMMGKWGNSQVPSGWKLQTAGAMKLDIGIDPQHLIKTDDPFNGVIDVIQAVKTNSTDNELSETLVNALETIHTQEHPVFPGQISNLPALRDYFGEIMGPVALMSDMVGGQAEDARRDLLRGIPWSSCSIFWPMAMNAPLVDSYFTAPDGTRVGISSKGGKGAKASVKNIQDAILKAPEELKAQFPVTVNVINIVQSNSAKDGPFRLAELYKILPQGLEQEINGYIQEGKQDYAGLSPACTELFNYGTPRQDVPGFNTGYAMLALLAKKVTRAINQSGPEFGQGCVAFLNQSSIVQLYCKMGKQGNDARVTGWEAVYPPNFQGTVEIDGSKNYYSSRIGGKFAFGFK
tara:strand:+ start:19563 stop:26594 length:7032 start_codon:yes stop_codon:yes gene_type:complete